MNANSAIFSFLLLLIKMQLTNWFSAQLRNCHTVMYGARKQVKWIVHTVLWWKVGLIYTIIFKTAKKNLQMKNMHFSEKNYQLYTLAASDPWRSKSKRKDPSKTLFMKRWTVQCPILIPATWHLWSWAHTFLGYNLSFAVNIPTFLRPSKTRKFPQRKMYGI